MSCGEFTVAPFGRQGIGVIQPQSGLDFPFVEPSADVRYLLADFFLAFDDPGDYDDATPTRRAPYRIKWLYGVGCEASNKPSWAPTPVHAADILVVDANDRTVFDSTALAPNAGDTAFQRYRKISWGTDYDIYEWFGTEAVCRLVVYKTWPAEFEIAPKNWPTHIVPTNGVLDARTVYKMPKRLRSISVSGSGLTPVRRQGVVFTAGNNMLLGATRVNTSTLRNETEITFAADPGAGDGRYTDCEDDSDKPVLRINGVAPDENGNILLVGQDCIFARRPTTLVGPRTVRPGGANQAALAIDSNCPACCDCPDYVAVARYMNNVRDKYKIMGRQTHNIKLLHESNIDRWMEQRQCRMQKPLRLLLTPQPCPLMDVVLFFCNHCDECAETPYLTVSFTTAPEEATAEIVCGYTQLYGGNASGQPVRVDGSWPTFSVMLPPVNKGNSAYVKFRLRFTPRDYPFAVTGTLTGTNEGAAIATTCDAGSAAAQAVATKALDCNELGQTATTCE